MPDLDVDLLRCGQLHAVDFDEFEVGQVALRLSQTQQAHNFADGGRLAGAGDAAHVHAPARTVRQLA